MRNFIKFLLIIIAIIVFVAIVWASMGLAAPAFLSSFPLLTSIFTWAAGFVATSPWWMVALAAFGALAVITPEAASAVGERLGEAAQVVGEAAGEVVSGGVSGAVDGLLSGSSGLALAAVAAFGIWFFFLRDKDEGPDESEKARLRAAVLIERQRQQELRAGEQDPEVRMWQNTRPEGA